MRGTSEEKLPKLGVAGSNPVRRSLEANGIINEISKSASPAPPLSPLGMIDACRARAPASRVRGHPVRSARSAGTRCAAVRGEQLGHGRTATVRWRSAKPGARAGDAGPVRGSWLDLAHENDSTPGQAELSGTNLSPCQQVPASVEVADEQLFPPAPALSVSVDLAAHIKGLNSKPLVELPD